MPIFARVFPKSIKINEKYSYRATLNYTPQIEDESPPSGEIEILIPYDGERYYSRQAANDIKRQSARPTGDNQVRIGYLGLERYKDLKEPPKFNIAYDVATLDLNIHTQKLPAANELEGNPHVCRMIYPYEPKSPKLKPVWINIEPEEENIGPFTPEELWQLFEKAPLDANQRRSLEVVAQQLRQPNRLHHNLVFWLQPILNLNEPIGSANDKKPPTVTRVALKWPVTVAHHHATLTPNTQAKPGENNQGIYNPEQSAIEWRNLAMAWRQKSDKQGLHLYKTAKLKLMIEEPGELYQTPHIDGTIEIELPRTLSGFQVEHFGASGQRSESERVTIEAKTKFTISFELDLEYLFAKQRFILHQHRHFPGMVLDNMRVDNIKRVLEQHGFTTRTQMLSAHGAYRRDLIVGYQTENRTPSWVWCLVEDEATFATHDKAIAREHNYHNQFETGHMDLYLRGSLQLDKDKYTSLLQDVQHRLKETLQFASTVE